MVNAALIRTRRRSHVWSATCGLGQAMEEAQEKAQVGASNEVARLRLDIITRDQKIHHLTTECGEACPLCIPLAALWRP